MLHSAAQCCSVAVAVAVAVAVVTVTTVDMTLTRLQQDAFIPTLAAIRRRALRARQAGSDAV